MKPMIMSGDDAEWIMVRVGMMPGDHGASVYGWQSLMAVAELLALDMPRQEFKELVHPQV
jgi:hypothetical protein